MKDPKNEIGGVEEDHTGTGGKGRTTLVLLEERRKLAKRRQPALTLLRRPTLVRSVLLSLGLSNRRPRSNRTSRKRLITARRLQPTLTKARNHCEETTTQIDTQLKTLKKVPKT